MPGDNENHRNLSHHGLKATQGHAQRGVHDVHSVGCPPMPEGILSMTPLGATKSSPYMPPPAAPEKPRR